MTWAQIKQLLTEPIISKEKDPLITIPLGILAAWIGITVYQRTGMSYAEYILWLIPVAVVFSGLYILLILLLKKNRMKKEK
ncbi:hypothetical protein [Planococcus sp. ISL-109]|uniref:hypothetical protein n=1 Tax=Planococcus sp. ISL-109 TaxID=2819166 RepID=UPI001BE60A0C|nr:hypothetical protein [Planococcus sp. ISL-109]MBT2584227.1 hypothetical protein [Planococcus sp. ISL-109]